MITRYFLLSAILFLLVTTGTSQPTTGHSGTGDNIDVKYHRFEWNIDPSLTFNIAGNVTTYFVTTKENVNVITFDLIKSSFDNSNLIVKYHGNTITHSFPSSGNQNILTITLPATLGINTLDSVTIFYNGVPQTPPSGQPGGCFQKIIAGYPLFYTLSESYEDKDWWPCKADMQDKIDSVDFIITTPADYTVAANGKLISETILGSDKTTLFKHRYPIASYQVGIAVSEYIKYDRGTVNIGGTDMPVEYYISKGRTPTTTQLNQMDACKEELVVFSQLFGDYPFKNEKYGMYEFGFGGGMEHNTFSGMSWGAFLAPTVVAHELFHQWFGDKVTMATWNHLWLSEGFASYGEVLAAEKIASLGINPSTIRADLKSKANNSYQRTYSCYIPDPYIVNSVALWNSQYGNTVYTRGGIVVSMLRILMGDDKFFSACRNYLNDFRLAYGAATTADLKAHLESELDGFDLSGFFNSFVFGNGYPIYSGANAIQWQAIGTDKIRFGRVGQDKSTGSNVEYYSAVIPLRVQGAGGEDTVIVLFDQGSTGVSIGGNGITFGNSPTPEVYLGFTPTIVTFDPFSMSLATGETVQTTVAPIGIISFKVAKKNGGNLAVLQLSAPSFPVKVELEKSNNGTDFLLVGSMEDKSNGSYIFQDEENIEPAFYRAKVTEATGEISYSEIIKVAGKDSPSFSLVANPSGRVIKIKVPATANNENIKVSVYDTGGRIILRTTAMTSDGILRLEGANFSVGTYFIHLQSTANRETLKIVINK